MIAILFRDRIAVAAGRRIAWRRNREMTPKKTAMTPKSRALAGGDEERPNLG